MLQLELQLAPLGTKCGTDRNARCLMGVDEMRREMQRGAIDQQALKFATNRSNQ